MLNLIHDQQYRHMNLTPGFAGIFKMNLQYWSEKIGFCDGKFRLHQFSILRILKKRFQIDALSSACDWLIFNKRLFDWLGVTTR